MAARGGGGSGAYPTPGAAGVNCRRLACPVFDSVCVLQDMAGWSGMENEMENETSMTAAKREGGHTPGPWVWAMYADGYHLVSETAFIYGSVRQPVGDGPEHADGILRAAAPDLLEALRECLTCEFAVTDKSAIAKAEAAIAQATGAGHD